MYLLRSVAEHTLRYDKRNDDVRKGLSAFSIDEKLIENRTKRKNHLNRQANDSTAKSFATGK